jgi:hypothetical protein
MTNESRNYRLCASMLMGYGYGGGEGGELDEDRKTDVGSRPLLNTYANMYSRAVFIL